MFDRVQNTPMQHGVRRNIDLVLIQTKIPCESLETISKRDKIFKNGPSKIYRRQPLKNLK